MSSLKRLSGSIGIVAGLLWLVRSFMWGGGPDFVVAAAVLMLGGVLVVFGKQLFYLAIGWGVFLGSQLTTIAHIFGVGRPFDLLSVPFLFGLLGLGLTVLTFERERRS